MGKHPRPQSKRGRVHTRRQKRVKVVKQLLAAWRRRN